MQEDPTGGYVKLEDYERLSAALNEAGRKVYGGNWIDHGADCELGQSDTSACTCGLLEWLKRNAVVLGISFSQRT
jgi:hypothetical protein